MARLFATCKNCGWTKRIVRSRRGRYIVMSVGALVGGAVGFAIGSSVGIASGGTAIAGTVPLAATGSAVGGLLGNSGFAVKENLFRCPKCSAWNHF